MALSHSVCLYRRWMCVYTGRRSRAALRSWSWSWTPAVLCRLLTCTETRRCTSPLARATSTASRGSNAAWELVLVSQARLTSSVRLYSRLFLSRGADIDIMNKEGDTPLSLARCDTPVWVALQINRKLRRGISNRVVRTERIICRSVCGL